MPDRPRNLRVLPKTLSTDSVEALMLGIADGLGVTCGYCHVGGDNPTWDSTNFQTDVKPTKVTARAMLELVNRLNHELLPPIVKRGPAAVAVTCMTCHRGAPRPVPLEDTLAIILDRQGVDSTIAAYQRLRERHNGGMAFDFRPWPLNEFASHLLAANRPRDAVRILEVNARQFPNSEEVAFQLGMAYEAAGDKQLAVTQYHKVLGILPTHRQAQRRLRVLTDGGKPPGPD